MSFAEPKFSVGDVVRLRTGGPLLTVQAIRPPSLTSRWEDFEVLCAWFECRLPLLANATASPSDVSTDPMWGECRKEIFSAGSLLKIENA